VVELQFYLAQSPVKREAAIVIFDSIAVVHTASAKPVMFLKAPLNHPVFGGSGILPARQLCIFKERPLTPFQNRGRHDAAIASMAFQKFL
jgi:hypothetical protein